MPRTAVGEARVATGVAVAAVSGVGDADCVGDGEDEGEAVVVTDADALTAGGELTEFGAELAVAWLGAALSAIDPVDDAANTAAPSAIRARIATIGTSPIRLPRG